MKKDQSWLFHSELWFLYYIELYSVISVLSPVKHMQLDSVRE